MVPLKRLPAILARSFSPQKPEADLPRPQSVLEWPHFDAPDTSQEVDLLLGCVMRTLFPNVHVATERLLRRVGARVVPIKGDCCGALHAHQGDLVGARVRALSMASGLTAKRTIVVNSAGCGSTMREWHHLDPRLAELAARVQDIAVYLLQNGLEDQLRNLPSKPVIVTYHDACHLAHGQGVRNEPRQLLRAVPGLQLIELEEADTCCGSAGIYNVLQPKLARKLVERKVDFIEATGAKYVVLGNPGCHAWIQQAVLERFGEDVQTLHFAEFLEMRLSGMV